jgi:hypothetical protein
MYLPPKHHEGALSQCTNISWWTSMVVKSSTVLDFLTHVMCFVLEVTWMNINLVKFNELCLMFVCVCVCFAMINFSFIIYVWLIWQFVKDLHFAILVC